MWRPIFTVVRLLLLTRICLLHAAAKSELVSLLNGGHYRPVSMSIGNKYMQPFPLGAILRYSTVRTVVA